MRIETRSHFWPATPELREIKFFLDGKEIVSTFVNFSQVAEMAEEFRCLYQYLMNIAKQLEHDLK
jgi:hypothetical protein